jgi:hypothetical protein
MSIHQKLQTNNSERTTNLLNQLDWQKSKFYSKFGLLHFHKNNEVKRINQAEVVTNYLKALFAYEALESDANLRNLEKANKEFQDFVGLKG